MQSTPRQRVTSTPPRSAGRDRRHSALGRTFTLLEFRPALRDGGTDTAIVYAASLTGELYLDKPHELQHYRDAHTTILGRALEETATQSLLMTAAKELEQ